MKEQESETPILDALFEEIHKKPKKKGKKIVYIVRRRKK